MDKRYPAINCQKMVVRFTFLNELEQEWEGHGSSTVDEIVSHLEANNIIAKGYFIPLS